MLLQTKFFAPASNPKSIERPRLISQVEKSVGRRLTMVIAPAGYGKTTLVSQWRHISNSAFTWLALDGSDNEPRRFWLYVIGAFTRIDSQLGAEANKLLSQSDFEHFEGAITSLVNDLSLYAAENPPIVLVLDDFHHITDFDIMRHFVYLIDYLPPTVHIAITSRTEPVLPLSRWRVKNYLNEIYAADLAFSDEECLRFFNDYMSLNISQSEAKAIREKTEGWVAAMQLAAISNESHAHAGIHQPLSSYSGHDRLINDYVLTEILNQQTEDITNFLLSSSCLLRLNGELCNYVLEREDSQELLEKLEHSNLFIIPLDTSHQWFRFHDLFRESLFHKLKLESPNKVIAFQQRATDWLLDHNHIHEAVDHLIQLKDWKWLKRVLEHHGNTLIHEGFHLPMLDWMAMLPEEYINEAPRLLMLKIWGFFFSSRIDIIKPLLEQLEDLLDKRVADSHPDADGALALHSEMSLIRSYLARAQSDSEGAKNLTQKVLEDIDNSNMPLKSVTYYGIGIDCFNKGDLVGADGALTSAIEYGKYEKKPSAVISSSGLLCWILFHKGDMNKAIDYCATTQSWLDSYLNDPTQPRMISCWQNSALCEVYREKNEPTISWSYLAPLLEHLENGTEPGQHIIIQYVRAHLAMRKGDYQDAVAYLEDAHNVYEQKKNSVVFEPPVLMAVRAKCHLALGNIEAAKRWYEQNKNVSQHYLNPLNREQHELSLARILLVLGNAEEALNRLAAVESDIRENNHTKNLIELLILNSWAHHSAKNEKQSVKLMEQALQLASVNGFIALFADEVGPISDIVKNCLNANIGSRFMSDIAGILNIHTKPSTAPLKTASTVKNTPIESNKEILAEPLSIREIEVLKLIDSGLANKEIASKLFLAPATVKAHIRNIYGKLDVKSRTEALARSRKLELL